MPLTTLSHTVTPTIPYKYHEPTYQDPLTLQVGFEVCSLGWQLDCHGGRKESLELTGPRAA